MTETTSHSENFAEHQATYQGFINGSIALGFWCFFILIALCSVGFGGTLPRFMALAGVVVGTMVILVDWRSGSKIWPLSLGFLVVYGLVTAINVS